MKRGDRISLHLMWILLLIVSGMAVWTLCFSDNEILMDRTCTRISDVLVERNWTAEKMKLPQVISQISPGETIKVSFEMPVAENASLYVNTDSSSLDIYAEGELIGTYLRKSSYHFPLKEIPSAYFSVPVHIDGRKSVQVQLVYHPSEANTLMVLRPYLAGSQTGILKTLINQYGIAAILSLIFVIVGGYHFLISYFFLEMEEKGNMIRWPGLMCILIGLFCFSENSLANYLIEKPLFMSVISLFVFPLMILPVLKLSERLIMNDYRKWVNLLTLAVEICIFILTLFSAAGILPLSGLSISFQWMHITALAMLAFLAVKSALSLRSKPQIIYSSAVILLLTASFMMAVLYLMGKPDLAMISFEYAFSAFAFAVSIIVMLYTKDVFKTKMKADELANEVAIVNKTIEIQKQKADLMLKNQEDLRRQRHDLRHHVTLMQQMLQVRDYEALEGYLQKISSEIPVYQNVHYCDNYNVNALLRHYVSLCQQKGIQITIQGNIPADCGTVLDSDLIVIIGNMLENAVEACQNLSGRKQILLQAGIFGEMLMITCENTYDVSTVHLKNGQFLSSKRPSFGTGTRSIRSMAEKYHGDADFLTGNQFTVRVYLDIKTE